MARHPCRTGGRPADGGNPGPREQPAPQQEANAGRAPTRWVTNRMIQRANRRRTARRHDQSVSPPNQRLPWCGGRWFGGIRAPITCPKTKPDVRPEELTTYRSITPGEPKQLKIFFP